MFTRCVFVCVFVLVCVAALVSRFCVCASYVAMSREAASLPSDMQVLANGRLRVPVHVLSYPASAVSRRFAPGLQAAPAFNVNRAHEKWMRSVRSVYRTMGPMSWTTARGGQSGACSMPDDSRQDVVDVIASAVLQCQSRRQQRDGTQ